MDDYGNGMLLQILTYSVIVNYLSKPCQGKIIAAKIQD